jgi:hypothetical protein
MNGERPPAPHLRKLTCKQRVNFPLPFRGVLFLLNSLFTRLLVLGKVWNLIVSFLVLPDEYAKVLYQRELLDGYLCCF